MTLVRGVRRTAVAASLLATALLGACGGDDGTTAATTTTVATTESEGDGSTTSTTADEGPAVDGQLIEVRVTGGRVEGGGRTTVSLGDTVTVRVTSDVADHVHVHGYDILRDVGAGETVDLTFDATIPGVFEVELEDARIQLLELQIS